MHRKFEDLLKINPYLVELVEEKKKVIDKLDCNKKTCKKWIDNINIRADFILRVRMEIVTGIENGNFYDFEDAVNIANYFGVVQCDWSQYGCPATDWED